MKRTLVTVSVLALAGVVLYAMAGFWIAPLLLERRLQAIVREDGNLDLAVEAVALNPFTLSLSLANVTLFRPESTPVVSFDRLEGRIQGVGFAEETLLLRDLVIRSLQVADDPGRPPALTAQSLVADALVLGPDLSSTSFDGPRMERPLVRLNRDPTGDVQVPQVLGFLLSAPWATGDIDVTLVMSDGTLSFIDHGLRAPHRLEVEEIDVSIRQRRVGPEITARASLHGRIARTGTAELSVEWLPGRPREKTRLELNLHRLALPRVSPYAAAIFDQEVVAGRMDLDLELSIDESMLDMDTRFVVEHLALGENDEPAARQTLPLDTAIALLEDADGRMSFDVPVSGRLDGRKGAAAAVANPLADALADAVTGYLASLAAAPFEYLAELAGRPGMRLGQLEFPPGSAEIRGDTTAKVSALNRVLELRPKLGFTVFPGLGEDADRKALARQQILLHVNLATSAGIPGQAVPESVDFDDPIVRSVLDEFAANRLPRWRQAALAEHNPEKDASYYRAVFAALVDNEVVAMPALVRLARYRARSVVERLAPSDDDGTRIRQAEEIVLAPPEGSAGAEVILEVRPADE